MRKFSFEKVIFQGLFSSEIFSHCFCNTCVGYMKSEAEASSRSHMMMHFPYLLKFLFATCELYKQMFDILTCCFSLLLVEEAGEVLPFACDLVGTSRLLAVEDCVAEVDAEGG